MTPPIESLTASFAGLTHEFLSMKAKAQARDKHGRFIKMNSIVRWQDSSNNHHWGSVHGIDHTGDIHVSEFGGHHDVALKPKQVEVVKALIPHNAAEAKAFEPAKPVSHVDNVKAHLNSVGVPTDKVDPAQHLTPVAAHEDAKDPWGEPLYVDTAGFKKVGGQGGSNPGGIFEAPDGTQYYIKKAEDEQHVANEILAARLYQDAGVKVPDVYATEWPDGSPAVASKMIPGMSPLYPHGQTTPATLAEGRHGFAMDAWLSNWDSIGLVFDNMMKDANGNAVRVDTGGALLYRAQGSPKGHLFGDQVGEIKTLRDSGMNPQAGKIFGGMTTEDIKKDIQNTVDKVDENKLNQLIDELPFSSQKIKDDLKKTMQARKDDLHNQFGIPASSDKPVNVNGPGGAEAIDLVQNPIQLDKTKVDDFLKNGPQPKAPSTPKPGSKFVKGMPHVQQPANLTPAQEASLNAYTESGYQSINGILRDGHLPEDNGSLLTEDQVWEHVDNLDAMIKAGTSQNDAVLYRGLKAGALPDLQTGTILSDQGYISATTSLDSAKEFTDDSWITGVKAKPGTVFHINAPAGSHMLDVEQTGLGVPGEEELILPRGSNFKVTSIHHEPDGTRIVHADMISAAAAEQLPPPAPATPSITPTPAKDIKAGDEFLSPSGGHFKALEDYNSESKSIKAESQVSGKVLNINATPNVALKKLEKSPSSKSVPPPLEVPAEDHLQSLPAPSLMKGDLVQLNDGTIAQLQDDWSYITPLKGLTGPQAGKEIGAKWHADDNLKKVDPHSAQGQEALAKAPKSQVYEDGPYQPPFVNQPKFTEEQHNALDEYTGDAYDHINGYLRGGNPDENGYWSQDALDEVIPHIDAAIQASTLQHDAITYRGTTKKVLQNPQPGQVVTDTAFMSTSSKIGVAKSFTGPGGTIMEIHLPAGAHAADADKAGLYNGENEFILPRNSQLLIKEVGVQSNGKKYVIADLLPKGPHSDAAKQGKEGLGDDPGGAQGGVPSADDLGTGGHPGDAAGPAGEGAPGQVGGFAVGDKVKTDVGAVGTVTNVNPKTGFYLVQSEHGPGKYWKSPDKLTKLEPEKQPEADSSVPSEPPTTGYEMAAAHLVQVLQDHGIDENLAGDNPDALKAYLADYAEHVNAGTLPAVGDIANAVQALADELGVELPSPDKAVSTDAKFVKPTSLHEGDVIHWAGKDQTVQAFVDGDGASFAVLQPTDGTAASYVGFLQDDNIPVVKGVLDSPSQSKFTQVKDLQPHDIVHHPAAMAGDYEVIESKPMPGAVVSKMQSIKLKNLQTGAESKLNIHASSKLKVTKPAGDSPQTPPEAATPPGPNGTLVPGSDHVYKDAQGEYVVTKNGHTLRVGDTVTSTKDGHTGTIVQLEKGPHYVKVKGADGKVKGRQMDTLVPAKPVETNAPEFSPKSTSDLKPGDKVKLPSGSTYTVESVKDTAGGGVHVHVVNDKTGQKLDKIYGKGDVLDTLSAPVSGPLSPQTPSDHAQVKGSELKPGDTLISKHGQPIGEISNPSAESGGSTKWDVVTPTGSHVSTWTTDHSTYTIAKGNEQNSPEPTKGALTPEQQWEKGYITQSEYIDETGKPTPPDGLTPEDHGPGVEKNLTEGKWGANSQGFGAKNQAGEFKQFNSVADAMDWAESSGSPAPSTSSVKSFKVGDQFTTMHGDHVTVTSVSATPDGWAHVQYEKTGGEKGIHAVPPNGDQFFVKPEPAASTPVTKKIKDLVPGDKAFAGQPTAGLTITSVKPITSQDVEVQYTNSDGEKFSNVFHKNDTTSFGKILPAVEGPAPTPMPAEGTTPGGKKVISTSDVKVGDHVQVITNIFPEGAPNVLKVDSVDGASLHAVSAKDEKMGYNIPAGAKLVKADVYNGLKPGDQIPAASMKPGMLIKGAGTGHLYTVLSGPSPADTNGKIPVHVKDMTTGKETTKNLAATHNMTVPSLEEQAAHASAAATPDGKPILQGKDLKVGDVVHSVNSAYPNGSPAALQVDHFVGDDMLHVVKVDDPEIGFQFYTDMPFVKADQPAQAAISSVPGGELKVGDTIQIAGKPFTVTSKDDSLSAFVVEGPTGVEYVMPSGVDYKKVNKVPAPAVGPEHHADMASPNAFVATPTKAMDVHFGDKIVHDGEVWTVTGEGPGLGENDINFSIEDKNGNSDVLSVLKVVQLDKVTNQESTTPATPATPTEPAAPSGTLVPGSTHVYKDAQGKYVVNKHGFVLREGMQVISTKDGHAGTIKLLELKAKYAKVKGADGSTKGRQIDTLKPVDANAQKVTPAPSVPTAGVPSPTDATPSGSSINTPGGLVPEVASKGWIQSGTKTPKQFKPGDVVGKHKQLVVSATPHPTNDKKTLVQFADQAAPLTLHNTTHWEKWDETLPGVIGKKSPAQFTKGDVVGTSPDDKKVVQQVSEWADTPGHVEVLFKGDSEWHSVPEDSSYYLWPHGTAPSPSTPTEPAGPVKLTHDPIDHTFAEGGTVSVPAGGSIYAPQYWSKQKPILVDAFGNSFTVDPATGATEPFSSASQSSYYLKNLKSSDQLVENPNQADVTPNLDAVLGEHKQALIDKLEVSVAPGSSSSWWSHGSHQALLKLLKDPSGGDALTQQEWQYSGQDLLSGLGSTLDEKTKSDFSIEIAKLQKKHTGTYAGEWKGGYPSTQYWFDANQRKALGALGLSKPSQDFVTTKSVSPMSNKDASAEIHAAVTDATNAQVIDDLFGHGTAAGIAKSIRGVQFKPGLSGNSSPYATKPPELPSAEGKNGTVFLGDNVVASDGQGGVVVLVTAEGKLRVRRSDGSHFTRKADSFTVTGSPVSSNKPQPTLASFTAKPRPEFQLADWTKSPVPGIGTMPDALAKIKESEKAGNVGWSFAADGGQVEDLNVHVNRVLDAQGQEMIELKFKLTPRQGDAMFKRNSADPAWDEKGIRIEARQLTSSNKLAQLTGQHSYTGNGGRTFTKKANGVEIRFHRANDKTMTQYGNNPVAFHNMVQIRMPADSSVADIQKAMYDAGVDKPGPSTSEDFLRLGDSRLLALFAGKTNAWVGNDNLSASSKATLLEGVKSQWGITAKDLGVAHGTNGRIELRLPQEVVDKIRAVTHVNYTMHSLTGGHDSLKNVGEGPHGALLSTSMRHTEGIKAAGMSSEPDIHSGGADYLFAYPRQTLAPMTGLIFDTSRLFQRMDWFTRSKDTYGTHAPNMDIIELTKPTAHEIMFKHRLDLNDAVGYVVSSQSQRKSTIEDLKNQGITHFGSRTVEEFVIVNPGQNITAPTPQVPITWLKDLAGGAS